MTSKFSAQIALVALLMGCTGCVFAQPIIYEGYRTDIFAGPWMPQCYCGGGYCPDKIDDVALYTVALLSGRGTPNTAQYLAMFSDKFVEINGKVFTVKNEKNNGGFPFSSKYPNEMDWMKNGLYEVISSGGSGVVYNLIYEDDNIGQIVASSMFHPIQIIGVDQTTNWIYGYYQDSNRAWTRKLTAWGDALDGSLVAEPVEDGEAAQIFGLSKNGMMFHLWGDFDFSTSGDIECAVRPAMIGDWTGSWAGYRGDYCPREGNNQLMKYTWHESGSVTTDMGWEPASKIARLGPKSNIYGVSTTGNLLQLWNDGGTMRCGPILNQAPLEEVRAVGGLDDGYARGIFVSNGEDQVYNVYWDGDWKMKKIDINYYEDKGDVSLFFGNHDGKTYLFYGWSKPDTDCRWAEFYLYRLNFVGGNDRYVAELLRSDDNILFCG